MPEMLFQPSSIKRGLPCICTGSSSVSKLLNMEKLDQFLLLLNRCCMLFTHTQKKKSGNASFLKFCNRAAVSAWGIWDLGYALKVPRFSCKWCSLIHQQMEQRPVQTTQKKASTGLNFPDLPRGFIQFDVTSYRKGARTAMRRQNLVLQGGDGRDKQLLKAAGAAFEDDQLFPCCLSLC